MLDPWTDMLSSALVVPAGAPHTDAIAARLGAEDWHVVTPGDGDDLGAAVAAAEDTAELALLVVGSRTAPAIAIEALDRGRWAQILDDHLGLARRAARAALPPMLARGRGNIVFVTSTLGQVGGMHQAATASAQGAVHGLMRALAREVAPTGVSVNAIAPGPDTPSAEIAATIADLLTAPHYFVGQVLGAGQGSVL